MYQELCETVTLTALYKAHSLVLTAPSGPFPVDSVLGHVPCFANGMLGSMTQARVQYVLGHYGSSSRNPELPCKEVWLPLLARLPSNREALSQPQVLQSSEWTLQACEEEVIMDDPAPEDTTPREAEETPH